MKFATRKTILRSDGAASIPVDSDMETSTFTLVAFEKGSGVDGQCCDKGKEGEGKRGH